MTHLATRWLLDNGCLIATWEVRDPWSGGVVDAIGVTHPDRVGEDAFVRVAYEAALGAYRGWVDGGMRGEPPRLLDPPSRGDQGPGRLVVVEAKISMGDLTRDLKAGKMHSYAAEDLTHGYLAITAQLAALLPQDGANLDLPEGWGILVADEDLGRLKSLKRARRLRATNRSSLAVYANRIAHTMAWRQLK